ncbi:hypothetical protein LCGC14_2517280, partial [marine sediment metagenome]
MIKRLGNNFTLWVFELRFQK